LLLKLTSRDKREGKMRGILYIGLVIFLIIILIPTLLIFSFDINVRKAEGERIVDSSEAIYVRVFKEDSKRIERVELEEYVKGVVASEMPASFHIEALKAQAVAARTKALYQRLKYGENGHPNHPGAEVCSEVHCQVYRNEEELRKIKSEGWYKNYWDKIVEAVESTRGIVATYAGNLIDPLYHSTSGGRTENSEDVFSTMEPYLRSVISPYEQASSHLEDTFVIPVSQFISKINNQYGNTGLSRNNIVDSLQILERSEGGRVTKIKVGNKILTGRNIRELLGLKSADFDIVVSGDKITFITRGYGHGVGMSQYGADGMAKEGYNYEQILKHYYQGIELEKY